MSDAIDTVTAYLDAWVEGDVEKGTSFYSDEIKCVLSGRSPVSGTYEGKVAFKRGYIDRVLEITGGRWSVDGYDAVYGDGNQAIALVHETFEVDGKSPLSGRRIAIYTVDDGKIVEMEAYDQDQYAVDELLS
jgi:ketosteroid isomerase-like protein